LAQKAKAVTKSARGSPSSQRELAKKCLADAVTHLEATQKQVAESLKSSGRALQSSVQNTPPRRVLLQKRSAKSLPQSVRPSSSKPATGEYHANFIAVIFEDKSEAYERLHVALQRFSRSEVGRRDVAALTSAIASKRWCIGVRSALPSSQICSAAFTC